MTTGLSPRALRFTVWALALAPALWFATFWLFVLRARLALGRWPAPYNPNPKDLGFDLHYYALLLGRAGIFSATFALVIVTALCWREMKAAGTDRYSRRASRV